MVGHLEAELKALNELAEVLISGKYLEIKDSIVYKEGSTKLTAMPVSYNLVEYLFTIEETSTSMFLTVRSTRIPELFISLPAPMVVQFGPPRLMEDLC